MALDMFWSTMWRISAAACSTPMPIGSAIFSRTARWALSRFSGIRPP